MNISFKVVLEVYKSGGGNIYIYLFNGTKNANMEVQDSDQSN
jgi:hypothetical protein